MITVTVSGNVTSGKTSIAYLINKFLFENGFITIIDFNDGESMESVSKNIDSRLPSIKEKHCIHIVEKNIYRSGSNIVE